MKTNIVGTNKKQLNEALLMSTHIFVETFSQASLNVVMFYETRKKKKKKKIQKYNTTRRSIPVICRSILVIGSVPGVL